MNLLDLDCFQFKTCQRYFGVLYHQIIYTTICGVLEEEELTIK